MDVTRLEKDIALGIAFAARAQQLALPTLDRCMPGMIGEKERQNLRAAASDLSFAAAHCRSALDCFSEAVKTLQAFTEESPGDWGRRE